MISRKKLVLSFIALLGSLLISRTSRAATADFFNNLWLQSEQKLPSPEIIPRSLPDLASPPDDPLAQGGIDISIDQIVASGFNLPVHVTHAGDGSGRLFVVEQAGVVKIIHSNGSVTSFLDIKNITLGPDDPPLPGETNKETGLFSIAFHPNYETNGRFFVYYSDLNDHIVLARYQVSSDPDQANTGSGQILLTIDHAAPRNHYGGQIAFGLDGYLYLAIGDGPGQHDNGNDAQNKQVLLGKILRIDVDGGSGAAPDCEGQGNGNYTIPNTNPFIGVTGCDEIWALGLRNPWRFSVDRANGDIYIGDVGQNTWEEVDRLPSGVAGLNLGWRCREGFHYRVTDPPKDPPQVCIDAYEAGDFIDPILEYEHTIGQSVTGGFVYRGSQYPDLYGYYFYADYINGQIWSVQVGPNGLLSTPELELDTTFNLSSFGEDESGELYIVDYRPNNNGKVRRIVDLGTTPPNLATSTKKVSQDTANPGDTVTYTILVNNTGGSADTTAFLTDNIPAGLTYKPGTLTATSGTADPSQAPALHWQGSLASAKQITITYQVQVAASSGTLINQAQLTAAGLNPVNLEEAVVIIPPSSNDDPTTLADFTLPGAQPNSDPDQFAPIPSPTECGACHTPPIQDKWRGSMMSHAGRDPLMWAALFAANIDAPNAGDYCLRCHTPKGWFEGRSHPANGGELEDQDIDAGVACEVCHRMVDPVPGAADEAAAIDPGIRASLPPTLTLPSNYVGSGMMIIDPEDRRRGPFTVEAPHQPTFRTDFLGQTSDNLTRSRMCGVCHNVDNPTLSWNDNPPNGAPPQFWPNGNDQPAPSFDNGQLFPIERTFEEWRNSAYVAGVHAPQFAGAKADGMVGACQDCHMPRSVGLAADYATAVSRDCQTTGCLPEHEFFGGNAWVPQLLQDPRWRLKSDATEALNNTVTNARLFLKKAATLSVTLTTAGASKTATVRVINETGHKLPTGYPEGRRMWLDLKAYNAAGQLIYESGAYDPATGLLTHDPAAKVYEAKLGVTAELVEALGRPDLPSGGGETFHFVLNNVILKDNRIPPRGYTAAAFDKPGLRPVGAAYTDGQYWDDTVYTVPAETERVVATLYYQTSSKEYIDFLRTNGGLDGIKLGQMWDDLKSPPELVASASFPNTAPPVFLPVVTKNK